MPGQPYMVYLELEMPESNVNQKLGKNFYCLSLLASCTVSCKGNQYEICQDVLQNGFFLRIAVLLSF